MKAKLFVISAPSGCGKTTLCKRLLSDNFGLVHSVSATTRPPRRDERKGVDYHFISEDRFCRMIKERRFLEHEANFGHLYGTPKRFISDSMKSGKSVLLSIDVKGAMKIKKKYPSSSVLIFILPPSVEILKKRLHLRKSDGEQAICVRLDLAKQEMSFKDKYDYRIVNDGLDNAYKRLKRIILSELNN